MKKLFSIVLLFAYLPVLAENVSLAYEENVLIEYAKPYIYLFEKNQVRTIKIPEMQVSQPIPLAFSDTSMARKFAPSSHLVFKVNQHLYLASNLGGEVYELKGNQLIRVDHSFEHKMQINAQTFIHDNRIFKFGGYGFWSARNFFTYFDFNSKEWEAYTPVQGEQLPPGLFDVNQFKKGVEVTYFNGVSITPNDNLKFERNQDVWHFHLGTKTWTYKGKSALFFGNNPQNFQYDKYYVAFNEERRIIRVNLADETYEIFENEAVSSKISAKFKPFVEKGIIYFFANNHANGEIELMAVPISQFLGNATLKADFIEQSIWSQYGTTIIYLISLFAFSTILYFGLTWRPRRASIIKDKDGLLYLGKATIQLEENELKVLKYLLKNDDVPNADLLSLVEQKGVHFSHNIRNKNDVLNQLNLKLKAILQVDMNFIVFKKSDTDSRLKVYRLNKQYFKVSEEFLNS